MTPSRGVARRARHGAEALHPFDDEDRFGQTTLGGTPRGPTLDRLVLAPPLLVPHRLEALKDLGREPVYADVGIDAVVVDGAEGGTAMAPSVALNELGRPTLACLARAADADLPILVAGGLSTGADVVKALALGADGCVMGRAFVEAAQVGGVEGVTNLLEALRVEIQLCTSALGKYDLADLDPEDVQTLDRDLAEALGVAWVMSPDPDR